MQEKQKAGSVDKSAQSKEDRTQGKDKRASVEVKQPTIQDVFDKKSYYNPGKIKSRLLKQLEKYESQLAESEEKAASLQLQLMDPALATDYEKLMELQMQLQEEEHRQENLLERMLEMETELENFHM